LKGNLKKKKFVAKGMVCASCEKIVAKQAHKVKGVKDIHVDYATGEGEVTYDGSVTSFDEILAKIGERGYACSADGGPQKNGLKEPLMMLGILAIVVGAYLIIEPTVEGYTPTLGQDASLALLFIVGLFTGFHCVAMCGGFVVSYTTKSAEEGKSTYMSHVKYGLAKTFSYAFFGAVFGLIGSYVAFTPLLRGLAAVLAGVFLIIFGLNMLGYLPRLKRLRLGMPAFLSRFISSHTGSDSGPATVGLLNGLMIACGPLQAIYLMAAATGSPFTGAAYLAAFGLGTLPVLLGFGVLTSALEVRMTKNILKYSGLVVVFLGLIMVNRGIALTGSGYDVNTLTASTRQAPQASAPAVETDSAGYQVIRMNVTAYGWRPDSFVLKKGVPVKWIIDGREITNCNKAIQVPKLGLRFDIKKGLQTIEFTPAEAGTIPWSCWMGMIPGTFTVVEDTQTQVAAEPETADAPPTTDYTETTAPPYEGTTAADPQASANVAVSKGTFQEIHMTVTASGWEPDRFVLKTGVPVKWVIDGQELTSCNRAIKVPSLGLEFDIKPGLQTIEFTPPKAGIIPWSCWMGMIKGSFLVKDDVNAQDQALLEKELESLPVQKSSGGCGCGMM